MNPLEDTLNIGPTIPRQAPTGGKPTASDLLSDLDAAQTIRMPGAGTLTFGRYRLQRVLGRGGMGVVWLAVDTKLERAVALKFLPDQVGIDPVALKELKEETRRGLDLAHPNIVRIYDFVDDDDGAAAISMEFVDGKSLSERRVAQPHHVFTVDQIGPWVGQMCDALDYAHVQKRIVHRDLKPANLMVNSESQIKITDFGISCSLSDTMSRLSRAQQNAGTSGTLLYMSPQQAMGDRPRPTDDVYAVGATLYELLTGKPPFYRGDITTQITSKTAPKLKDRREELEIAAADDIPKEWEEAIAACLDKDPARRPQTAGELSQMLGVSLRGEAPKPPAPSSVKTNSGGLRQIDVPAPPTSRSATERKEAAPSSPLAKLILVGSLVLVLVAGLIAGGLWWWTNRPGEWSVQTSPAGATVTIDGKTVKAPAVIGELKPGKYEALVKLEGYDDLKVAFNVAPGEKVDIGTVKLEQSMGKLTLSSDPAGVPFEVKSKTHPAMEAERGETPRTLELPAGEYEVTLKHQTGPKFADMTVEPKGQASKHFKIDLPPPPAPTPAPAPAPTPPVIARNDPPAAPAPAPAPGPAGPAPSTPDSPPATPPAPGPAPSPAPSPLSVLPPSLSGGSLGGGVGGGLANPAANPPGPAPAPAPGPLAGPGAPQQPRATPPDPNPLPGANPAPGTPGVNMGLGGGQPTVGEPDGGFWKLDEMFQSSPYNTFTENGQRYVLYQAQKKLKISADGKVGKGTHGAITKFQESNGLIPTGMLDGPTLAALELNTVTDNPKWSAPGGGGGGGGGKKGGSGGGSSDGDKTWIRKQIERNILGGRDLKDAFKRR